VGRAEGVPDHCFQIESPIKPFPWGIYLQGDHTPVKSKNPYLTAIVEASVQIAD